MIPLILLLATLAHGQASTDTIAVPLLDSIQISNLGKDTRSLLSGRYTQTGRPTFQGGITVGIGTTSPANPLTVGVSALVVTGGLVGIGTASPVGKTYVLGAGTQYSVAASDAPQDLTVEGIVSGANAANILAWTSDSFGTDGGGTVGFGGRYTATSNAMFAKVKGAKENPTSGNTAGYLSLWSRPNGGSNTERVRIDSTGNVGIGTASPAKTLTVVGDIRVGTSGTNGCVEQFAGAALTGVCASDRRLKTNIKTVAGALDIISALRPVTFEWASSSTTNRLYRHGKATSYGLIAQEVAGVIPALVQKDATGYLNVDYGLALPMLTIKAVGELNDKLDAVIAALAAANIQVNYAKPLPWVAPLPNKADADYLVGMSTGTR